VVQRKIGPGQYVNSGASDPVFVIGDLSTVWLTAFVRETEASTVVVGQELTFNLLALPGRTLTGASTTSRRRSIRHPPPDGARHGGQCKRTIEA